ncbi:unnamed protein product [Kuraishia capsulata CBS 1993]|uniref:Uncharacterized protein n=1 Tax=Kuraishia capsulata CBS 1993 TaxID=1382522 RepID=W6MNZ7_9ASCO|nr:uncharacterized protein KUCA_T00004376001 [Kuraishia capsulata CBS 1993]CDK28394.1 unnamed protein product [Kuraishia capsulata CBS 1993]
MEYNATNKSLKVGRVSTYLLEMVQILERNVLGVVVLKETIVRRDRLGADIGANEFEEVIFCG